MLTWGDTALADLLLQIFFHYSPRGIPLHDRAFVTLVIGGVFTTPLLVLPLAKRTLIRLNSALSLILYPIVLAILLAKIYTWTADDLPALVNDKIGVAIHPIPQLPNANPFSPPSIWGPYSLLPLLTLSSSPLQIMQHQSSLRRKGLSGSNVKAFMGAQTAQVLAVVGICAGFGIGVGLNGMHQRLKLEVHPNLFTSLPKDDDTVNLARLLFIFLLSTHLALCIVTARSSWSRILRRFKLNPLRRRQNVHHSSSGLPKTRAEPSGPRISHEGSNNAQGVNSATSADEGHETGPQTGGSASSSPAKPFAIANGSSRRPRAPPKKVKAPRRWGKLSRNALAGLILWALVAGLAYMSGNGRIRRGGGEKDGEEARFTRASEILGLLGAAVGFVIPSLVWVILFWIRRPRNILQIGASDNVRDLERRPLLPRTSQDAGEGSSSGNRLHPSSSHVASQGDHWHSTFQAVPIGGGKKKKRADNATILDPDWDSEDEGHRGSKLVKTWVRDQDGAHMDEATTILLAKKELQMQKQTRG